MLYVGTKKDVKNYRLFNAKNQSTLKGLEKGLDAYLAELAKRKLKKDGPVEEHFIIGGAVDTILTGDPEDFEKDYYVSKHDKPSETLMSIVMFVYNFAKKQIVDGEKLLKSDSKLEDFEDMIAASILHHNYYPNLKKMETKLAKVLVEPCKMFFLDLVQSKGRIILSKEQDSLVTRIVKSLTSNPRTAYLFDREAYARNENLNIYYQLPVYFKYQGTNCKALFDIVIEDTADKNDIHIYPIDLKTSFGNVLQMFPLNFRTRRYDLQASFYTEALVNKDAVSPYPITLGGGPKVTVHNFMFVAESTDYPGKPLKFTLDEDYLSIGHWGKTNTYTGRVVTKGFHELLNDFIYYEETLFKEDRTVTKYDGDLTLTFEGVKP